MGPEGIVGVGLLTFDRCKNYAAGVFKIFCKKFLIFFGVCAHFLIYMIYDCCVLPDFSSGR